MQRDIALIVLFNENNQILLQHRTNDAPTYPGYWGFFGGKIENSENPKNAIKRETFEELNYTLSNPKLVLTLNYKTETHHGKKFYFTKKYNKNPLNLQEGQDMKWVTFVQAKNLKINNWNKKILEQLENIIKSKTNKNKIIEIN
jgi:8-oxo-dGTP diphosphatase